YSKLARERRGPEGLAIAEANYRVSMVGELFIYAVFVLGALLVAQSKAAGTGHRLFTFSDTWVWLSAAIYILALGVAPAVPPPAVRRALALMRETAHVAAPSDPATPAPHHDLELKRLDARIGVTGALLDLALVAIVVLMVWKP